MIKLETEFTSGVGGYSQTPGPLKYKQVIRNDKYAVYQRFYADGTHKDYEVFRIKIKKAGTVIFNNTIQEDTECYPSTEADFGRNAWSICGEQKSAYLAAMNKYNTLNNAPAPADVSFGEVEQVVENTQDTQDAPTRKRGRVAKARASVVYPSGKQFTIKELLEINPDYSQPLMYLHIQSEIKANKVVEAGELKTATCRGKKPKLYSLS